jgi:hypothetical protein
MFPGLEVDIEKELLRYKDYAEKVLTTISIIFTFTDFVLFRFGL